MPPVFEIAVPFIRISALVERAERGDDIVLSREGVPCARIVPIPPPVRTFTAVIERCRDAGVYVGYVPGLVGAHSQGETLDELHANLAETVALVFEDGEPAFGAEFAGILTVRVRPAARSCLHGPALTGPSGSSVLVPCKAGFRLP